MPRPDWRTGIVIADQDANLAVDIVAQALSQLAVDISAQTLANLTVDINAQTLAQLAVNIAAQAAALDVNLAAQAANIDVNLAAQAANLDVNLAAQAANLAVSIAAQLANIDINVAAQGRAVSPGPEYASQTGDDKDFNDFGNSIDATSEETVITYTVPAGKTLYVVGYYETGAAAGYILIQEGVSGAIRFQRAFSANAIADALFFRPLVFAAAEQLKVVVGNSSGGAAAYNTKVVGYES